MMRTLSIHQVPAAFLRERSALTQEGSGRKSVLGCLGDVLGIASLEKSPGMQGRVP